MPAPFTALQHCQTTTEQRVLSTNVAVAQPDPAGADRVSGINKQPCGSISVFTPGPNYGDGSGVRGDVIGDSKHHGGAHKAVYAMTREELDYWESELGKSLHNGAFGDNLTTVGVDWASVVINQQVFVGSAVLEVSVARQPCRTFGAWLEQKGWMKTFTQRAQAGCYFRVIGPGEIAPGDAITFGPAPSHGVTMGEVFRAKMGDKELARKAVDTGCLPAMYHEQLERLLR